MGNQAFVLRVQALAPDRAASNQEIWKAQRASPKTLHDWLHELPSRHEAIVAAHRQSHMSL